MLSFTIPPNKIHYSCYGQHTWIDTGFNFTYCKYCGTKGWNNQGKIEPVENKKEDLDLMEIINLTEEVFSP